MTQNEIKSMIQQRTAHLAASLEEINEVFSEKGAGAAADLSEVAAYIRGLLPAKKTVGTLAVTESSTEVVIRGVPTDMRTLILRADDETAAAVTGGTENGGLELYFVPNTYSGGLYIGWIGASQSVLRSAVVCSLSEEGLSFTTNQVIPLLPGSYRWEAWTWTALEEYLLTVRAGLPVQVGDATYYGSNTESAAESYEV